MDATDAFYQAKRNHSIAQDNIGQWTMLREEQQDVCNRLTIRKNVIEALLQQLQRVEDDIGAANASASKAQGCYEVAIRQTGLHAASMATAFTQTTMGDVEACYRKEYARLDNELSTARNALSHAQTELETHTQALAHWEGEMDYFARRM